jgi:hypothetical protein
MILSGEPRVDLKSAKDIGDRSKRDVVLTIGH